MGSYFFALHRDHEDLHSFPTRRSSDLSPGRPPAVCSCGDCGRGAAGHCGLSRAGLGARAASPAAAGSRSEEHTSELQSLTKLVCRRLAEKKNEAAHISPPATHENSPTH